MCEKNPLEKLEFTNQFDSSVDSSLPYKLVQEEHNDRGGSGWVFLGPGPVVQREKTFIVQINWISENLFIGIQFFLLHESILYG